MSRFSVHFILTLMAPKWSQLSLFSIGTCILIRVECTQMIADVLVENTGHSILVQLKSLKKCHPLMSLHRVLSLKYVVHNNSVVTTIFVCSP